MFEDVEVAILTCRLMGVLGHSVCSLLISWLGLMELNTLLKSTNSILMVGAFRLVECVVEDEGNGIICGSIIPVDELMFFEARWDVTFNVLHRGHRSVIIQPPDGRGFGQGFMVAVFRQMGTVA